MRIRRCLPLFALGLVACSQLGDGETCFVAGTPVRTPTGDVPIEDIRVGDVVLAFRERDGAVVERRVVTLFGGVVTRVRVLELEDGRTLRTTDEHPFWDAERREWTPARAVVRDTILVHVEADGRTTRPMRVLRTRDEVVHETRVLNFTVDGEHTFFAAGVATHNKSVAPVFNPRSLGAFDVVNETNQPITLDVRSPLPDARVSSAIATGRQSMPLAANVFGPASALHVPAAGTARAGGDVAIIGDGSSVPRKNAALITLPGAEPVLAIGEGDVVVRERDGALVVEAKDPRAVVVTGIERDAPACTAHPRTGFRIDGSATYGGTFSLLDTSDGECAVIAASTGAPPFIHVCMPRSSLPFAPGEELRASDPITRGATGIRLERADGVALDLLRIQGGRSRVVQFEGLVISSRQPTTCIDGCRAEVATELEAALPPGDTRQFISLGGRACHVSGCNETACDDRETVDFALVTSPPR